LATEWVEVKAGDAPLLWKGIYLHLGEGSYSREVLDYLAGLGRASVEEENSPCSTCHVGGNECRNCEEMREFLRRKIPKPAKRKKHA